MCDQEISDVTSLVDVCSNLSSLRAKDALDSLISCNILMIASFCDGAEDAWTWSAVFKVLTVPVFFPTYEPSNCVESFLVFLTETLARQMQLLSSSYFVAFSYKKASLKLTKIFFKFKTISLEFEMASNLKVTPQS